MQILRYLAVAILAGILAGPALANKPADHLDRLFCLTGDTGINPEQVYALAEQMADLGCDQVHVLGDLIYPNGLTSKDDPNAERLFFSPFRPLIDNGVPFYLVLGNHDYRLETEHVWIEIAAEHPWLHYPDYYYTTRVGELCIINLDTNFFEKLDYPIQRFQQSGWLDATLDGLMGQCGYTMALAHHPYRSSTPDDNASLQLGWELKSHVIGRVDLYVSGHSHILADEGQAEGTHLLISGSAARLHDTSSRTDLTRFAVSRHGFLGIRFSRADDRLLAVATFYGCSEDAAEGRCPLEQLWQTEIPGVGVR